MATALAATWFFMSSAPRPQTWSSARSPDQGSRDHSAGSATTVSVWERKQSEGPSPPLDPGDEVRPLGNAGVQLDLDAVRLQIVAQQLCGDRLVAGRVDGVQAQQLLQQPDGFLLQAHWSCEQGRELVADAPQLREEDVLDQPAEHLHGRALRADDRVADHAGDDLVVPDPPEVDPLVAARSRPRRAGTAPRAPAPGRRRPRARGRPARGAREKPGRPAARPGAARASRASRSRCRGRAPCGSPGTPTGDICSSMSSCVGRVAEAERRPAEQAQRRCDLVRAADEQSPPRRRSTPA